MANDVVRDTELTLELVQRTTGRRRCLEAGMNDFIAKPIDAEELIRKIATHTKSELKK